MPGPKAAGKDKDAAKPAKAAPITVNQELLRAVGAVRTLDKPLKVLGHGEIDRALFVVADAFSRTAVAKIEAAGGSVQVIELPTTALKALGVEGRDGADGDARPETAAARRAAKRDAEEAADDAPRQPAKAAPRSRRRGEHKPRRRLDAEPATKPARQRSRDSRARRHRRAFARGPCRRQVRSLTRRRRRHRAAHRARARSRRSRRRAQPATRPTPAGPSQPEQPKRRLPCAAPPPRPRPRADPNQNQLPHRQPSLRRRRLTVFESLLNAFRAPDIRRRLLYVAGILIVFRFLSHVPVPGVDQHRAGELLQRQRPLRPARPLLAAAACRRSPSSALA